MIALLDTSQDLAICEAELGCSVEQLLTPLSRMNRQNKRAKFAIDNGAFSGFQQGPFKALLLREKDAKEQCRFLTVPDVVGSARRTLEVFRHWQYKLAGWPLALVAQDGIEDLDIPWEDIAAIFIGGTTSFKLSSEAKAVVMAARAMGKWSHVGRVNTPARFEYFDAMGVDSIDGQGLSQYSHMREKVWNRFNQPHLLSHQTDHAPSAVESSVLADGELPGNTVLLSQPQSIAETASEITAESTNESAE